MKRTILACISFTILFLLILLCYISLLILPCCISLIEAKTFKVVSYNVQTLFDLTKDGTEFNEYIPNTTYGWTQKMLDIKAGNIAEVINDLKADVVMLQEVESKKSLLLLRNKLKNLQVNYPYFAIADSKATTMKCAVLSKFPIVEKKEIPVDNEFARDILKITLDIDGNFFILFNNHWKSKRSPESHRIAYAKTLKREIDKLKYKDDFILVGDFNSNYNEYDTFKNNNKLNDTAGITGINHILQTIKNFQMVNEQIMTTQVANEYLYNLWLEIYKNRRWSHNLFGKKNSLDNIIISNALYDDKGISYIDNSFDKFDPDYLFKENKVYRWQRARKGHGKHLGKGYSDHLPIFANFSNKPFHFQNNGSLPDENMNVTLQKSKKMTISDLYASKIGPVNYSLEKCAVIYKYKNNAIIKQKNGRAIFLYKIGSNLEYGKVYNLRVKILDDYHGLRQIIKINALKKVSQTTNLVFYLRNDPAADFSEPDLQNEIVSEIEGIYNRGYLYYGHNLKIKLYFKDKKLKPENGLLIVLKKVRIGYYKYPELVIEKSEQISLR